ncbi:hypothetical protein N7474_007513 [Penicillium riverlandense]|uniref:uncharacterized protein n=1 Tax=Penicillium riverlandense TaxID=1903569 RepID=UPI002548DBE7|nr:uncharacterized protein N7474_007513 [Penicillium riverlandense]KAJ5815736.1 hypothetical protein N7474_007513 [Penicillium riverlandense]
MQSTLIRPIIRPATSLLLLRSFSAAPAIMGAGDTGAPKPRGFLAEKDQFTRREAAEEAMYIRKQEMDKLESLRKKMKESQKHLDELDKHIEEYTQGQGGEQN